MPDSLRRAIRTLMQLIAGGGATALVAVLADGLTAQQAAVIMAVATFVATFCQNFLEDNTSFPAVLKARASDGANPVGVSPTGRA